MKRRTLSALLAFLMVIGLLGGCSSEKEPVTEVTPENASVVSDSEPATTGEKETESAESTVTLPLSDELVTLTAFRQFDEGQGLSEINENPVWIELENRTNVHIDWTTYSGQSLEPFYLFVASQDYTDMFFTNANYYNGGTDKAIEDGVYVAANDYMGIMPNFASVLSANEDVARQSKTDSGNIMFRDVCNSVQPSYIGAGVRGDWLDDCGLSVPVTYDDWYEMLTAFKNEKGASSPLVMSNLGYSTFGYALTCGYNTVGDFYAENGTTVRYGFTQDGMKDYLEMMNKWYSEGLIDQDFISHNNFVYGETAYADGSAGAFEDMIYTMISDYPTKNSDEGNYVVPVPYPSKTEEEQGTLHFGQANQIIGENAVFITTAAVKRGVDELCARWLDYRYTKEGSDLFNYGIEGTTFEYDENGEPKYTDFFLNNDEYTAREMMTRWTDYIMGGIYCWERENQLYGDDVLAAYDVWAASSKCDWTMPPITMTAEEAEEFAVIYNDISVYVDEAVLQFITGAKSFDDWDDFVAHVESMGIEECIEYKQTALDRYLNR